MSDQVVAITHYAGAMPVWLAPIQAVVMNITESQVEYAASLEKYLKEQGIRSEADLRNEKISYKIREHSLEKVPYLLVVGHRERDEHTVAVRARAGMDLGVMSVNAFVERLRQVGKALR